MSYNVHNDPDKRREDCRTPRELFDFLDVECNFNFKVDCAADRYNTLCDFYIDKTNDFLSVSSFDPNLWHWCNPPYLVGHNGKIKAEKIRWMRKLMSVPHIVCLIPAAIGAEWFQPVWNKASALCFLRKRLKFIHPHIGEVSSAQFDTCLAIHGTRTANFNRLHEIGNTVFLRDPSGLRLFEPYSG